MKRMPIAALLAVCAYAFATRAIAGPANLPASVAHIPAAAGNAVWAAASEQARSRQFSIPFVRQQQQQQQQMCRIRSFFGSDVAKPLEVVYFARHGSVCGAVPFYGFVLAQ